MASDALEKVRTTREWYAVFAAVNAPNYSLLRQLVTRFLSTVASADGEGLDLLMIRLLDCRYVVFEYDDLYGRLVESFVNLDSVRYGRKCATLVSVLDSVDQASRLNRASLRAVVRALGHLRAPSTSRGFLALCRLQDEELSFEILRVAKRLADPESIHYLAYVLKSSKHPQLLTAALEIFCNLGSPRQRRRRIFRLFRGGSTSLQLLVLDIDWGFGSRRRFGLLKALYKLDVHLNVRRSILGKIAERPTDAAAAFLADVARSEADVRIRFAAANRLRSMSAQYIPRFILASLASASPDQVRFGMAKAAELETAKAIQLLRPLMLRLGSMPGISRIFLVEAVGRVLDRQVDGDTRGLEWLLDICDGRGAEAQVALAAVTRSLQPAVAPLLTTLFHYEPASVLSIVHKIALSADRGAVDDLLPALVKRCLRHGEATIRFLGYEFALASRVAGCVVDAWRHLDHEEVGLATAVEKLFADHISRHPALLAALPLADGLTRKRTSAEPVLRGLCTFRWEPSDWIRPLLAVVIPRMRIPPAADVGAVSGEIELLWLFILRYAALWFEAFARLIRDVSDAPTYRAYLAIANMVPPSVSATLPDILYQRLVDGSAPDSLMTVRLLARRSDAELHGRLVNWLLAGSTPGAPDYAMLRQSLIAMPTAG